MDLSPAPQGAVMPLPPGGLEQPGAADGIPAASFGPRSRYASPMLRAASARVDTADGVMLSSGLAPFSRP